MKFACVSALLLASASAFSPANVARTERTFSTVSRNWMEHDKYLEDFVARLCHTISFLSSSIFFGILSNFILHSCASQFF